MKYVKPLFALVAIAFFIALSGSTMSSCTKDHTDTVYIQHDSLIYVHDTTTLPDTGYGPVNGLIAYYNFDGGNLADSSGYHNDINFNNATLTADRNGVPDNAYLFDGASNYMEVPNSSSLNPQNITMYAIFKVNGFYQGRDHDNFLFVKDWDESTGMYLLEFSDFALSSDPPDSVQESFLGGFGGNNNTTASARASNTGMYVTKGVWYKLAYTYDGTTANLYLNGKLIAATTATVTYTPTGGGLHIGREEDARGALLYPYWFNGVIDEIRIYNRALSSQEIATLMNLP